MKKKDIFLILGLLAALVIALVVYLSINGSNSDKNYVVVRHNGVIIFEEEYSKELEMVKVIENGDDYNLLSIKNGEIKMVEANCPDQKCVFQGSISLDNYFLPIICAPHSLVVSIESSENLIDA